MSVNTVEVAYVSVVSRAKLPTTQRKFASGHSTCIYSVRDRMRPVIQEIHMKSARFAFKHISGTGSAAPDAAYTVPNATRRTLLLAAVLWVSEMFFRVLGFEKTSCLIKYSNTVPSDRLRK